jgi:putative transposase
VCERLIGTLRRECLDWLIPLSEAQLRTTLRSWVQHYNRRRPHVGLGPGLPDPPTIPIARPTSRHRRGEPYVVRADPILGGLHHEYALATA